MGAAATETPHLPVLIGPLVAACAPIRGTWLDGTFGAGGYAQALLAAGAERVIGLDRDPSIVEIAQWALKNPQVQLVEDTFSNLDAHGADLDGVVLDLGVSSMQLDQADRGFSFQKDGPLDMRMGSGGTTAAEIVNTASEEEIAEILFIYGEERASRRIARRIVARRAETPFETTLDLARLVESCLPRPKPGQSHPATRSFQALRIAVNDEYGQLAEGLMAAERALKPGGHLAVVTFHSVEDRMVKRFLQERAGKRASVSRYAPEIEQETPAFEIVTKKAVTANATELAANPRARSAKLRVARRTEAPATPIERAKLGMPRLKRDR